MIVETGDVSSRPSACISDEQLRAGHFLACVSTAEGDVTVRIPQESRAGRVRPTLDAADSERAILPLADYGSRLPAHSSPPPVVKRTLHLDPPSVTDNSSDAARVRLALRKGSNIRDATISMNALRELPRVAREGNWTITAITAEPCDTMPCVSGFHPGDTSVRQYAIAIDVGTTTVEAALVDLNSREILSRAAQYNSQCRTGADVISRIIASAGDGMDEMHQLIVGDIVDLSEQLIQTAGISVDDIVAYYAAGNTVMTHLLLNITPEYIRESPYTPAASSFPWMRAKELGLPGSRACRFIALPCPASWLGGDVVAGITAAGIPWTERLTLFVDIGTNGELALGNSEWLVGASCSAGPTFEGSGIAHGMRAADGAIERVRIDDDTLEPSFATIGGTKPLGICGSGLIDCISELFMCGALGRDGRFATGLPGDRIRLGESGSEYLLADARQTGTGRDIVINENDVAALMRAKAAIHAGIHILCESMDLSPESIEEVVIAGGFGAYLDIDRILSLGMLPEIDKDRFVFLGNASLLGTTLVATNREIFRTVRRVAQMTTYLELTRNAGFMDLYVSALFFPHTETASYPKVEYARAQRAHLKAVS